MPALTLNQKAIMAADQNFQAKMLSWMTNRANYWKDFENPPVTLANINVQTQKRKRLSIQILVSNWGPPNVLQFSKFFLDKYTNTNPVFDAVYTTILADSEIETAAWDAAYDFFACTNNADSTNQNIIW
jgi:hypothetical protein